MVIFHSYVSLPEGSFSIGIPLMWLGMTVSSRNLFQKLVTNPPDCAQRAQSTSSSTTRRETTENLKVSQIFGTSQNMTYIHIYGRSVGYVYI